MKCTYLTLLLFIVLFSTQNAVAQYTAKDLCKPDVISFSGQLYTFGYIEKDKNLLAQVQRLSKSLIVEKEQVLDLGKRSCKDVYGIQADTIHGYLNLVIQEVNNDKTCRIIRLDKNLKTITDIASAEITRVNTFTAYDKEVAYYKNQLFVIRPFSKDSAHHFFLQKYALKDSSKTFEYGLTWQFNFGKQNYHSCHIMRVDSSYIYLFANVNSGSRQGQWVLYVDPIKGEIAHAERLNDEQEGFTFLYSAHYYNTQTKEFSVAGYKLRKASVAADYSKIDLSIGKSKTVPVFVCTFDSAGALSERLENCISVPTDVEREKEFKQYLFKIRKLKVTNESCSMLCELIANNGANSIFKTYGFQYTLLERNEEGVMKPKANVFTNTYRDSKNKEAKNMVNIYEMNTKECADEILYKAAVSGPYKQFVWSTEPTGEKAAGYALHTNRKEQIIFKYVFAENKWQMSELVRLPITEIIRSFVPDIKGMYYFKNSTYDAETKITKGLEGIVYPFGL